MVTRRTTSSTLLKIVALSVVYAAVARLGLMLDAVSGFASLVWAPTGLALSAILLFGLRVLPGVFLGALFVNLWSGAPFVAALGIASGNSLEAVVGAWAMRHVADFRGSFDRLRHVLGLSVPVAVLSTLLSATIGVTSLALAGIVSGRASILATWRAWWIGDMLGDLVVAPLLLTWGSAWGSARSIRITPARVVEATLLAVMLTLVSLSVFSRALPAARYPFEYPYVLFPIFIWAAVRFGLRGAATASGVVSAIAIWGTVRGLGPFARQTLAEGLLRVQTFVGSAAFTTLVVAGAIAERARALGVRETFVATVSHDLRNPLGTIQMSAASLGRTPPADLSPDRVQQHVALVERNVKRMTRLIKDMLDAAAIEAGHLSVEPREEDAAALIEEVMEIWKPVAAAKDLMLKARGGDRISVACDRERVLQVLANLVGNALKFTKHGGAITVTVERVGRSARFTVEDTGSGIEPKQLRHVFERYWHGQTTSGGGTGLGLFIAKGIIEAHGGKVWAESKVGVGSAFHFTLPLHGGRPSAPIEQVVLPQS